MSEAMDPSIDDLSCLLGWWILKLRLEGEGGLIFQATNQPTLLSILFSRNISEERHPAK